MENKLADFATTNNPSNNLTIILSNFLSILDKHAPIVSISRQQSKLMAKPWISKAILKSIKTKNKLYHKHCKNRKDIAYFNDYKQYNNLLTKIKKIAKQKYYTTQLNNNTKNPRKTWQIINSK